MVVDALYGTKCPCGCGGIKDVEKTDITIDDDLMEEVMKEVYNAMVDTGTDEDEKSQYVSPTLLSATEEIFEDAIAEGFKDGKGNIQSDKKFTKTFVESADVFSIFRSHKESQVMASIINDEDGNTRPFEEWKKDVEEFVNPRWNKAWLKTEYDTAVLRSKQAGDWKQFTEDADVWPNLKWMPTSSVNPEEVHESFWSKGLTKPVGDSFWDEHHPADHWNCKCWLKQTDDDATTDKKSVAIDAKGPEKAQPGLNGIPYKTKQLFSKDHPYFVSSCKDCPFYKGELTKGDEPKCVGGKCPYNALKQYLKK